MKKILFMEMLVMLILSFFITACSTSSSTASCAFVFGSGMDGHDTKLHEVIYPGKQVVLDTGERVSYFPCNSRNYIINDGTVFNANQEKVGDRFVLITATTKTGVPITIAARALWTLNQSKSAMEDFYNVCFKYQCASPQDQSGDVNFSTAGWNGMLAENFGPAMDASARQAAIVADDTIWEQHNPDQYKALGDRMSAVFADNMRANLGYPEDLFCGSGNSSWTDPSNPGVGTFTCSPVRIVVDSVQRGQIQASESTVGALSINQQRLTNAQALYGPDAGYWLALQDTIDKCKGAGTTCIFNIGGIGGNPAVAVPMNNPTATPAVTPTTTP